MSVAASQETTVLGSPLSRHVPVFHLRAPYSHHRYIDAPLLSFAHDEVHLAPVGLFSVARDDLHLHHIQLIPPAVVQIETNLTAVELMGEQPTRVAQPEERPAIVMLQITLVGRDTQFPLVSAQSR